MWYKIKQGRHRAYPLSLGIHTGKTSESYEVIFDESCRYVPDEENDWNKLVGWSYGMHHKNSIRIGWRYNSSRDIMELASYTYDSGIRKDIHIADVELNKKCEIIILAGSGELSIIVDSFWYHSEPIWMKPTWGYNLGLFFGGNETAPHDMKVWIKKLKKY